MTKAIHEMRLFWLGPFFWPGYGSPTLPAVSSVYLWTVESRHDGYPDGYFLYLAGETIDALYRHGQHTRSLRLGKWTIFDMEAMQHCERKKIREGSDWTHREPGSPDEVKMIEAAGQRMMADLRLFIAEMPDEAAVRSAGSRDASSAASRRRRTDHGDERVQQPDLWPARNDERLAGASDTRPQAICTGSSI